MPHLSHVFTLTMKFASMSSIGSEMLWTHCGPKTFPIPSRIFSMMMPNMGGVPLNKTIITQWPGISPCSIYPVYRILGLNVMKCYDCSSWPTQWSLQGIIHVRRCEAAKALQERFPTRGQTTARGDVLSAPVVQGCLLSFWGKKSVFFSGFFLLMFGNIFWKMLFLLIFLGDPNSRMIWVKYHKISWGMWKNMLWTSCFRFFLLHRVVGKRGTQKNPVVCHGLSFSSMFKKVWVKTEEPFGSHQRPQRNYFIWVFASLLFDS